MKVSNEEPGDDGGWGQLIRLQSEYQARLTEETLRYLRSLQAAFSPRAPGTIVRSNGTRLDGIAVAGDTVSFQLEVENRQRAHTPVSPALTPFTGDDGSTWYPLVEIEPAALIMGPDESRTMSIVVHVPGELAGGTYRGSLVLHGFTSEGVPVTIDVAVADSTGTDEQPR